MASPGSPDASPILGGVLPELAVKRAVIAALEEDAPYGDMTSLALIPPGTRARLSVVFRQGGVVCGLDAARETFLRVAPACTWTVQAQEGDTVNGGAVAATVQGEARLLLGGERVALNFMQRLSGIATLTARFVAAARAVNPDVRVAATRKTTPGLRVLEKHAVITGGGAPHRYSLSDGVLIKDNHLAALAQAGISLKQALAQARVRWPHTLAVQVEADTEAQALDALAAGADWLLLDNMAPEIMARVVLAAKAAPGRKVGVEASGGITLDSIPKVAASGVDVISVGGLTHSAPALDIGLDFEMTP